MNSGSGFNARRKVLLIHGKNTIPKDERKFLANHVEEILCVQDYLLDHEPEIVTLARHDTSLLISKNL
jgi:hypothetical protein